MHMYRRIECLLIQRTSGTLLAFFWGSAMEVFLVILFGGLGDAFCDGATGYLDTWYLGYLGDNCNLVI